LGFEGKKNIRKPKPPFGAAEKDGIDEKEVKQRGGEKSKTHSAKPKRN